MDFVRFLFCLAVGLVGLCMVLMTVLETLLAEWDLSAEMRAFVRSRRFRLRELLGHAEEESQARGGRINAYGRPSREERSLEREDEPAGV